MTLTPTTLQKRTKQELIEEFEKVQSRLEELQSKSKTIHSQAALDVLQEAKTITPQTVETIFFNFQGSLQNHLRDLRSSVAEQVKLFHELQTAVELASEQLEVQHALTITAESIGNLVEEQARQRSEFEDEQEKKKIELDEQMAAKKKAWEREVEEYEYQKKVSREHDQRETDERQKAMDTREAAILAQETEIASMKTKIEGFPAELDSALKKQEEAIREHIREVFTHEKALYERETSAQIRLLELQVKNLEERLATQIQEMVALKKQTEEAQTKAQELAMKAIERPTTIVTPQTQMAPQQTNYHDRRSSNQ
jgi:hypothetical protein